MTFSFDPRQGLVVLPAELFGPRGSTIVRLALDTGATCTLINAALLVAIGYNTATCEDRIRVTTGSGVEYAPLMKITQFTVLGVTCKNMDVLVHTLPPSAGVDGLLGINFLRGRILKVDFRRGTILLK